MDDSTQRHPAAANADLWAGLMAHVAPALLGEPNSRLSHPSAGELRYGTRGSLVVHVPPHRRAGRWHDFETCDGGGVIDLVARENGGDEAAAAYWLRHSGFLPNAASSPASPPAQPAPRRNRTDTANLARRRTDTRRIWETSTAIPLDGEHPARRWATRRNLWHDAFPVPSALRWLDAAGFPTWGDWPSPDTAGAIIALIAPPEAWVAAWTGLPEVAAVQILPVRSDGDGGGLEKRTRGEPRDGVCIFGNPRPEDAQDPAHVTEGIADALALSSRYPGPAVAAIGTSGLASVALATWLASLDTGTVIVADADPVNPRTGQRPGQVAAGKLRWRIQQQGGSATARWPTAGKDFADLAAGDPFPPLDDAFGDYASTIREMFPAWPRWETARTADVGNQSDAAAVREFVGALADAAKDWQCGVLICAHSTKSARDGKQDPFDPGQISGSAAWVDACRGALALTLHPDKAEFRRLAIIKANYGPSRLAIDLNPRKMTADGAIVGFDGGSDGWQTEAMIGAGNPPATPKPTTPPLNTTAATPHRNGRPMPNV